MADNRLCLGAIAGAHGVRGEVRIKTFTASPEAIGTYGALQDEAGTREFEITRCRASKGGVVAALKGVSDRNAAEALKSTRLYVNRAQLPDLSGEDEFYHADLIGLAAQLADGTDFGMVIAIHNFGAGDMLEIRLPDEKETVYLPFTRETVPQVDMEERVLTVTPPEEVE